MKKCRNLIIPPAFRTEQILPDVTTPQSCLPNSIKAKNKHHFSMSFPPKFLPPPLGDAPSSCHRKYRKLATLWAIIEESSGEKQVREEIRGFCRADLISIKTANEKVRERRVCKFLKIFLTRGWGLGWFGGVFCAWDEIQTKFNGIEAFASGRNSWKVRSFEGIIENSWT